MIAIEPKHARIGDTVQYGGLSSLSGVVCGLDTNDNGAVLVRWDMVPGCDVIGVLSPVWLHWGIWRHDDAQAEMPLEDTDTVTEGVALAAIESEPVPFKLPWSK
jgi:hypothetical protein